MIFIPRSLVAVAFLHVFLVTGCTGVSVDGELRYPIIKPAELNVGITDCDHLDHHLRQVDAVRWSMREDGIELETNFEQMVQLSLATAAAIAIAVPLISIAYPDPTLLFLPYGAAFTAADNLKQTDALLIALLTKRGELNCPPHPECVIQSDRGDTLASLRRIRERVESKEMPEIEGLQELTTLLDGLCPVGDLGLYRLRVKEMRGSQGENGPD